MNTPKIITLFFLSVLLLISCTDQQLMQTRDILAGPASSALSNEEVVSGLKEALTVGTQNAAGLGSKVDGYLKNPKIRIPFPPEAEKVKEKAIALGLQSQVDQFETTLNRSAEEAAKYAAPIFVNAIKSMSIQDGFDILKGGDNAATDFLRRATYDQLYAKFSPEVDKAVNKMKVGQYWQPLSSAYNTATLITGGEKVDPDLNAYVTTRAVDGLFVLLAEEEKDIRQDPAARVTDLLKKVFAAQD